MTTPVGLTPGLHQITEAGYHADPAPEPSLSSSIAHILLSRSPRHAWQAHPKLNPAYVPDEREAFDVGKAAHAYLLEGRSPFELIDAADWRTKAAQEARDAARRAQKIPLLQRQWADVVAMAEAVHLQLGQHAERPLPLTAGKPEQTLIWREQDIWCRARLDWLHDDRTAIDDYKSTSASAHPEVWTRSMFNYGYDLQAAFYLRGLQAVFPGCAPKMRFVVQENTPPYAASVIALGPDALVLAEKKVLLALELWARCLETNTWPAYPTETCYASVPPWLEAAWLAREESER